jgi:hypothetical protein
MAEDISKVVFKKKLPPNASTKEIADHVRYMQEAIDFKLQVIIDQVNKLTAQVGGGS